MPLNFDPKSLESFQSKLGSIDQPWNSSLCLKDIIGQSLPLIKKARSLGVPWEHIAATLEEAVDNSVTINPASVKQYYFELSKKKSKSGKKSKPSGLPKAITTITAQREVKYSTYDTLDSSKNHPSESNLEPEFGEDYSEDPLDNSPQQMDFDLQEVLEAIPPESTRSTGWVETKFNQNRVRPRH